MHAYVDESFRGDYIMCAVLVPDARVASARTASRKLLKPGQTRVHRAKESDGHRRELISAIVEIETNSQIVAVRMGSQSQRQARDACLRKLTLALLERGVTRLVLESCDQDADDRQVIGDELPAAARLGNVSVVHHRAHEEPLLWMADVVAWSYAKGGWWRQRVQPFIAEIRG